MAAQNASTTGAEIPYDLRKRNVQGQPNGTHVPDAVGEKVNEKTKQKVYTKIHVSMQMIE